MLHRSFPYRSAISKPTREKCSALTQSGSFFFSHGYEFWHINPSLQCQVKTQITEKSISFGDVRIFFAEMRDLSSRLRNQWLLCRVVCLSWCFRPEFRQWVLLNLDEEFYILNWGTWGYWLLDWDKISLYWHCFLSGFLFYRCSLSMNWSFLCLAGYLPF